MSTELVEVLENQVKLFRSLRDVCTGEVDVLRSDNLDGLSGFVDRKNALIESLQSLDEKLSPLRASWPSQQRSAGAAVSGRVAQLAKEIDETIRQVMALEQEAQQRVVDKSGSIEKDLSALQKGREALGHYKDQEATSPQFLDKRG